MGIYIPNMEMPKNCFECPWRCKVDPDNLLCRISGEHFEETFGGTIKSRHKSCPLVPVPPHGRLGDLDALHKEIDRLCDQYDAGIIEALTCLNGILMAISNAPTIILADPATGEVVENE